MKKNIPEKGISSIVYYNLQAAAISRLPDALRLRVHDAIDAYILTGTEPNDPELAYTVFPMILEQIKRDWAAYKIQCEKNREKVAKYRERHNFTDD